jgi:nicotinate-nucleotide pyrophosphorylase (carboxylating)
MNNERSFGLTDLQIEPIVRTALMEDIGAGDITTSSIVPSDRNATAQMLAKSAGVICGLAVAQMAFELVDPSIRFEAKVHEGAKVEGKREVIATIAGSARGILTGERVALNFLQRLSGVATLTSRFVEAVAGTQAQIVDTRKTTPGIRVLEKYAVRVGGGFNHRFGLHDGLLIKDNHIAAAGGVGKAVSSARKNAPHTLKIEVEAKELGQVGEALDAGADVILLDNMSASMMQEAVKMVHKRSTGKVLMEASGGINLQTAAEVASAGVDLISVGALTHSAPAMDISLDIVL